MRVGFLGDVVGRPGREIIKEYLQDARENLGLDLVVANTENAAHGFGLTGKTATELFSYGIDVMTGGNHTWDKKEINALFDSMAIIRPLNYPEGAKGSGSIVVDVGGISFGIINVLGHFTMPMVENPFNTVIKEVETLRERGIKHILLDVHAEATSEKNAFFQILKGKVSAIAGTHTHVGTDDLLISQHTGYVTEAGMNGCLDGVIGMGSKEPIYKFTTGMKASFEVPKKCFKIFQMVVYDIDDEGRCTNIEKYRGYNGGDLVKSEGFTID